MFRAIIIGNLGSDAKVESNNGKPFVSFSVGHNDRWTDANGNVKESTQWISCALNGDGGQLLQYLKKGKSVYVEGRCTTRVFSSQKLRCMVAGVNLSVDHLELLASKPAEEVPRQLGDSNGGLHNVNKAYYIENGEAEELLGNEQAVPMFSTDGRLFTLQRGGWVSPVLQPTEEEVQQQGADDEGK